jgi:hypothetical protein
MDRTQDVALAGVHGDNGADPAAQALGCSADANSASARTVLTLGS